MTKLGHLELRIAFLLALGSVVGCSKPPAVVEFPPLGVSVSKPLVRPVADAVYFTGRTEGSEYVEVRARVSGYLTNMDFKPGSFIKKDKLLFEIDDRPYVAALQQAAGQVAQAKARADRLSLDVERSKALIARNAISHEEFDKTNSDYSEAVAAKDIAAAVQSRAQLDVEWTKITSPIDGIVSRDLVNVGNLVAANQTLLTTIVKQDPIFATFDVDERTFLRILSLIRAGKIKSVRENQIPIDLALANDVGYPHHGFINFVENQVNSATGTLRLRGRFDNPILAHGETGIAAGLFARVRLELGEPASTMLLTERAILSDQSQKYVLVVSDKNEIQRRDIKVGSLQDGLRVIESGLGSDDLVVVNSLQKVRPGLTVKPQEVPMPNSALEPVPVVLPKNPAADSKASAEPKAPATESKVPAAIKPTESPKVPPPAAGK